VAATAELASIADAGEGVATIEGPPFPPATGAPQKPAATAAAVISATGQIAEVVLPENAQHMISQRSLRLANGLR
jgi:hypothetical protein